MARKRKKKPAVDVDIVCLKCAHPMRVKVFRKVVMPGTPAEVEFETQVESNNQQLLFDEEKPATPENVKVKSREEPKAPEPKAEGAVEGLDAGKPKGKGKKKK